MYTEQPQRAGGCSRASGCTERELLGQGLQSEMATEVSSSRVLGATALASPQHPLPRAQGAGMGFREG